MLRESRRANAKAQEEIKELKATIKMQEEKLKQMKDTPLLALVEREGYLWSSELTPNGQKTLSTGAALLFQDNHVRNGVSLEKLPDAFGNFLMATFGPDMIDQTTYSALVNAPNTYSYAMDKLETMVAGDTKNLFAAREDPDRVIACTLLMDATCQDGNDVGSKVFVYRSKKGKVGHRAMKYDISTSKKAANSEANSFESMCNEIGKNNVPFIHSGTSDGAGAAIKEIEILLGHCDDEAVANPNPDMYIEYSIEVSKLYII
jgi:hypothetical protein